MPMTPIARADDILYQGKFGGFYKEGLALRDVIVKHIHEAVDEALKDRKPLPALATVISRLEGLVTQAETVRDAINNGGPPIPPSCGMMKVFQERIIAARALI